MLALGRTFICINQFVRQLVQGTSVVNDVRKCLIYWFFKVTGIDGTKRGGLLKVGQFNFIVASLRT